MRRREAATLVFLIAFAAFAFIPRWRTAELWGMAVFGWLIAALMVMSPALALAAFVVGRGGGVAGRGAGGGTSHRSSRATPSTNGESD